MGGEYFDLLIQKVSSGVKLLRTWSGNEIERMTGWLKRMNARGHDVLIRPAGEHGLVLVNALNAEETQRLQNSRFAAAAVIEIAPGHHQAWVKLSDQAIPPRVRAMVGESLAEKRPDAPEHGSQNAYGCLAGFMNHSSGLGSEGRQPNVLVRDCPGRVAPNGPAYLAHVGQTLDQADAAQEKKRRLDAIESFQEDRLQSDPIYEYRRQAKQLLAQHGNGIDLARMDQMVATEMLKSSYYGKGGVENALRFASPNCASMKGGTQENYVWQTAHHAVSMLAKQPTLHEERQRNYDWDRSRGQDLGR